MLGRNVNYPQAHNTSHYMAKLVLGKSVLSDWFFLDRDFAVRSKACIFVLEKSRQIQN